MTPKLGTRQTVGVIRAKLAVPSLAEQRVPRARLERRLAELLERHRVVVVSATPGAGKTTAVAGAVLGLGRPAAWLTVDRTDAAPGRLVTYLEAALAQRGLGEIDAHAAVDATGGWVTGVLFEAWTASTELAGAGGEADPLHGYLSAHILDHLPAGAREFLVTTSLLDEVTATRAHALGVANAVEVLKTLRSERLPVAWGDRGRSMRCHSRFREYLLERLEERGPDAVRALRIAHGHLLASEGLAEDAVEELLAADAPEEALPLAEQAHVAVSERLDAALAERWLERLAGLHTASPALVAAELMLAIGGEDFRRAELVVDRISAQGERDRLARASGLVGALMAWAYGCVGRMAEAGAMLDLAPPDPAVDAMRYGFVHFVAGAPRVPRPELTGGPLDALVLATDYLFGRLGELVEHEGSRFVDAVAAAPRRIAVLRALGRTQEALEVYDATLARTGPTLQIEGYVGPELLTDAGRPEDAMAALARGRALARASGSSVFEVGVEVADARFRLRLEHDPAAARAVLEHAERDLDGRSIPMYAETIDTWYGLALLQQGGDGEALLRLRRAVAGMLAGGRMLELPTAAVYLAEAEWRAGDEEAADRAADVALDAARRQGSNHVLLQALADFPAVVSRRIDAEPHAVSPWHELGRALIAQGKPVAAQIRAAVELLEFGRSAIVVDGVERRPRIAKTYELLAYLAVSRDLRAERAELLDALFDGRTDDSTRAYLRQAVRWLRRVLPPEDAVIAERGAVQLSDAVAVSTESVRFEALLAEAARRRGDERFAPTVAALALHDQGDYLPDGRSRWVDRRRSDLLALATDARADAAELALAAGRLADADLLAQGVLRIEPFRESAWRVTMQVAGALGDHDGVLRAYQACERELAGVGTTPSPGTRELLERLRR